MTVISEHNIYLVYISLSYLRAWISQYYTGNIHVSRRFYIDIVHSFTIFKRQLVFLLIYEAHAMFLKISVLKYRMHSLWSLCYERSELVQITPQNISTLISLRLVNTKKIINLVQVRYPNFVRVKKTFSSRSWNLFYTYTYATVWKKKSNISWKCWTYPTMMVTAIIWNYTNISFFFLNHKLAEKIKFVIRHPLNRFIVYCCSGMFW